MRFAKFPWSYYRGLKIVIENWLYEKTNWSDDDLWDRNHKAENLIGVIVKSEETKTLPQS